jgi:hypothetical protein
MRALQGPANQREFDRVSTPGADGTVLIVENIDQASVRAQLTLLWDAGHEVLSFGGHCDAGPISTTFGGRV